VRAQAAAAGRRLPLDEPVHRRGRRARQQRPLQLHTAAARQLTLHTLPQAHRHAGGAAALLRLPRRHQLLPARLLDPGDMSPFLRIMIFPVYSFQSFYWLLICAKSLSINSISVFLLSF